MAYGRRMKTEHTGAKNGGGAWMRRLDAKGYSRKARRAADKKLSKHEENILTLIDAIFPDEPDAKRIETPAPRYTRAPCR